MTAISRKKFVDAPISTAVERRELLRELLAAEDGQPLEEERSDGAHVWRSGEGCTWRVTFSSLADVATWLTVTCEPCPSHLADEKLGCRLSRALEAFCSEVEAAQRAGPSSGNGRGAAPTIIRRASGLAGA